MQMNEPKTALIIDDDPDFVTAIETLLKSDGYKVRTAANGRDGLQMAKTLQPDIILLDVMMSERTEGVFVLQDIRSTPALSRTPVIVISSIYADQPMFRVSPEAGWLPADLFLPKPIDPARLLEEARRLTGNAVSAEAQVSGRRSDQ